MSKENSKKFGFVDFIFCFFGVHNIHDGSTCWFSKKFWDIHNYTNDKGGNGRKSVFNFYTCPNCRTVFTLK